MSSSSEDAAAIKPNRETQWGPVSEGAVTPRAYAASRKPGRHDAFFYAGKLEACVWEGNQSRAPVQSLVQYTGQVLVPKVHPHGGMVYQPSTGSLVLLFQKSLHDLLELLRDVRFGLNQLSLISNGTWWEKGRMGFQGERVWPGGSLPPSCLARPRVTVDKSLRLWASVSWPVE